MNKYKGIIFDLDGTLVDTADDLKTALNEAFDQYDLPLANREQVVSWIGNGLRELVRKALPEDLKTNEELIDKIFSHLQKSYKKYWLKDTKAYEGIGEILEFCKENNIKIAVSSNKPNEASNFIINGLFPNIKFDWIEGAKAGRPHKPSPEQTNFVIEQLELKPYELLMIGDSAVDYQTAQNSLIEPIIVEYGYGNKDELKKIEGLKLIPNTKELLGVLKEKFEIR